MEKPFFIYRHPNGTAPQLRCAVKNLILIPELQKFVLEPSS
jgi:hypothetical protein